MGDVWKIGMLNTRYEKVKSTSFQLIRFPTLTVSFKTFTDRQTTVSQSLYYHVTMNTSELLSRRYPFLRRIFTTHFSTQYHSLFVQLSNPRRNPYAHSYISACKI